MGRKAVFKTCAGIPENFVIRISTIQIVGISKGSDSSERVVGVKQATNSAKRIRRKMKAGEFDIERIPKNHISGYGRSEKVSWNLIKKVTLDGKTKIWEQEVLTIDAASPSMISNGAGIIVERRPV